MSAQVFIDTHVHIYELFELEKMLVDVERKSKLLCGETCSTAILCLVDRVGKEAFPRLRELALRNERVGEYALECNADALLIEARRADFSILFLHGKQWVTKERIEVLGLGTEIQLQDGLHTNDVVEAVRIAQGLPVIPWSPGKWTGSRRKVVELLIEGSSPGEISFGDIAIRPSGMFDGLLKKARSRGFSILPGGDPLPIRGEESVIGTYGVRTENFESNSSGSILDLLRTPSPLWKSVGKQNGFFEAAVRWTKAKL